MVRATTGGVLRSYRSNLMNSFKTLNKSRDTVLSQRIFNSYAEDPASAAKAFKLRKSRMATQSQYNVCNDVYRKNQSAWTCLDSIDKLIDTETGTALSTLKGTTLEMLNDPTGDARVQLATALDQMSETIVQMLNQKYGDNFIFAGADGHNVPFEVREVDGHNKLFYRGVDVDAVVPKVLKGASGEPEVIKLKDGKVDATGDSYYILPTATMVRIDPNDPNASVPENALKNSDGTEYIYNDGTNDYYIIQDNNAFISEAAYNRASEDAAKLQYLVNEKCFVDIGLGFQENLKGQLIESSGYNAALIGLHFIGYGVDGDGDPKNIYSLVQRLKEIAGGVDDGGQWSTEEYDEFFGLVQKLEDASSDFKTAYTNMDAGTTKLKNNLELLEENFYNLQEQYSDLEDVDMADAITSFIWAQYCYNAALKVGNSILSESLMDYLR